MPGKREPGMAGAANRHPGREVLVGSKPITIRVGEFVSGPRREQTAEQFGPKAKPYADYQALLEG